MPGTDSAFRLTEPSLIELASARLKLRQAAWGPEGEPMSLDTIQCLACGLQADVTVDFSALGRGTVFPASTGRVLLNVLMLAADSLPEGGSIVLAGAADDLFVQIAGPGAGWPFELTLCIANQTAARAALTNARTWQMALTALFALAASIRFSVLLSPTARTDPAILRLGG